MMKTIVTKNEVVRMNFEEVLASYRPFAMKCLNKYKNGGFITEDDMQEIDIVIFKAFNDYNEIHCFSTHLVWKLKQYFVHMATNAKRMKRDDSNFEILNLDMNVGKDGEGEQSLHELLTDEKTNLEQGFQDKEFLKYISDNITESELCLLSVLLGRIKPIELAQQQNTSKQNISGKLRRFKSKLADLVANYNEI